MVKQKPFMGAEDLRRSLDDGTAVVKKVGFDIDIRVCWTLPFIKVHVNWVRQVQRV